MNAGAIAIALIAVVGLLVTILVLPISDASRGQLLSLLGILLSAAILFGSLVLLLLMVGVPAALALLPQELETEAGPFGRALDQPRDIGDHEAAMPGDADHAEIWVQRGKRVIGHLGARRRHRADESRLAGVGHTEQADIRDDLEFEHELELLALAASAALPRRAVGRALVARIAEAVISAARDQYRLRLGGHVG